MNKALLIALTAAPLFACSVGVDDLENVESADTSADTALSFPQWIDFDLGVTRSIFPVGAAPVVADGAIIDTAYAGVTFSCVYCSSGHAYARFLSSNGNNGVSLIDPAVSFLPFFDSRFGAVKAEFATPRSWVSIDARPVLPPEWLGTPVGMPWIEAYDANGTLLMKTLYPFAYGQPGWGTAQTLQVSGNGAVIKYVRFSSRYVANTPPVYGEFDNLQFNGDELRPIKLIDPPFRPVRPLP